MPFAQIAQLFHVAAGLLYTIIVYNPRVREGQRTRDAIHGDLEHLKKSPPLPVPLRLSPTLPFSGVFIPLITPNGGDHSSLITITPIVMKLHQKRYSMT